MAAAKKKQSAKSGAKTTKSTTTAKTTKAKTPAKKTTAAAKAKSTAKKTTATAKTKKTSSNASGKKSTATKSSSSKKTSSIKTSTPKVTDFLSDIIKQCSKAQKAAQAQTKTLAKQLSALDKEQAQLTKKQTTAKGTTWQTLDAKLTKLKTQSAVVRTALLDCENNEDKIATLAEYASTLNSRATPSTYLPTSLATPSKPTLVKNNPPKQTYATPSTSTKAQPLHDDYLDEDDYPDEEDLDLDDNEEIGFVFGDEDESDDEMLR